MNDFENEGAFDEEELRQYLHLLESQADAQARKRQPIEDRWLADLRQYHGKYDPQTLNQLGENQSRVFVNLTRPKANTAEARLGDMLFPTDDRNWGIKPTPVPEGAETDQAAEPLKGVGGKTIIDPVTGEPLTLTEPKQKTKGEVTLDMARKAEAMQRVMEDQMVESRFQAHCRDVIHDAVVMGTGILKGPMVMTRKRGRWRPTGESEQGRAAPVLENETVQRPFFERVDPWGFFPDMNARGMEEAAFIFQRHLMSEKELRRLPDRPGFNRAAIRELLADGASKTGADYPHFSELRAIAGLNGYDESRRFEVWEYHGPVDGANLELLALASGQPELLDELDEWNTWEGAERGAMSEGDEQAGGADKPGKSRKSDRKGQPSQKGHSSASGKSKKSGKSDKSGPASRASGGVVEYGEGDEQGPASEPLKQVEAVVWFCHGRLLKFGLNHLESGELPFAVFNWEREETSLFGYGIPYLMRGPQRVMNAAYRMILDNAALSTGPQIIMDRGIIEPADGQWRLTPRKIWFKQDRSQPVDNAFRAFNIDSRQPELAAIYGLARQLADEETNQPMVVQGEPPVQANSTAFGISIMHSAANVIQRRTVRNFDDDLIKPVMGRLYQWNMQFHDSAAIKGDFEVHARGSSVLLAREIQARNMMAMALQFASHPVFGPMTKAAPLYRKLAQVHMLAADEFIKSDDEIQAESATRQGMPRAMDPRIQVEMGKLSLQQQQLALKAEETRLRLELDLIKLAAAQDLNLGLLRAELGLAGQGEPSGAVGMGMAAPDASFPGAGGQPGGAGGWMGAGPGHPGMDDGMAMAAQASGGGSGPIADPLQGMAGAGFEAELFGAQEDDPLADSEAASEPVPGAGS